LTIKEWGAEENINKYRVHTPHPTFILIYRRHQLARGTPKRHFTKQQNRKPKHNWRNEGGSKKKMLDMRRQKYFKFDLVDKLEATRNQDNKDLIVATLVQKASQSGVDDALEYLERLSGETLEPEISEDVKKLLLRYSTFR